MPAKSPEAIAWKNSPDNPAVQRKRDKDRAAHAQRQRAYTARHPHYRQREHERLQERHVKEWSYATMWLMTADGEADNDAVYDQFALYDGEAFHDHGRPGRAITLSTWLKWMRNVVWNVKQKDSTRRANVVHFFSYHYDLDKLIGAEPLLSEAEKLQIANMRSSSYGVQRQEGWEREIPFPQLGVALYVGRKETVIRYLKMENGIPRQNDDGQYETAYTLYLHDTYTLTAQSFLKTIAPLEKTLTGVERERFLELSALIEEGKAERGEWSASFDYSKRKQYNHAELETMWWWLHHIIDGCQKIGLAPRTLAGPAPFARALITKYDLKTHVQIPDYDSVDYQHGIEMQWEKRSYYGGRIEMCGQGVCAVHSECDLTSAYPAALANMPCPAHGHWVKHQQYLGTGLQPYSRYRITWKPKKGEKHRYGPVPVRDKRGNIFYPLAGDGIYCGVEVAALLPYWDVRIKGWMEWVSECNEATPFKRMVEEMFAKRAEAIAAGDESVALVIKLALNSLYGIFAQCAGAARIVDEHGVLLRYKLPSSYNLAAAGYITAHARAKMYTVAMTIGEERILGFATDAVFIEGTLSETLLAQLDVTDDQHKQLGKLTLEVHDDPTAFIAPGIRCSKSGQIKKSRGYPFAHNFEELCENWRAGKQFIRQTRKRYMDIRMTAKHPELRGKFINSARITAINAGVLMTKRNIPNNFTPSPDTFTVYPPYARMRGMNYPYRRKFEKSLAELLADDKLGGKWDYYE